METRCTSWGTAIPTRSSWAECKWSALGALGCGSDLRVELRTDGDHSFGLVLDARKSGLRIKPAVKKAHQQERDGYLRWYAHKKGEEEKGRRQLKRPKKLGHFIVGFGYAGHCCADERHC
jgi:hypothetical protein